MKKSEIKTKIQNNWPFYLAVCSIILIMRYFGRAEDADALLWILALTARWAGILGGISFEYLPHQGYVNHFYQFLIAASCSGIRFMLLTFLMLVFMPASTSAKSIRNKFGNLAASIILAYGFTVLVNGIRIVLAIRLPLLLEGNGLMTGWLTPDRLHTLIGTVVYFTALCGLYLCAASTTGRGRLFVPVCWYLLIVLILPFVNRVWNHNWKGFGQYAAVVLGGCMFIYMIFRCLFILMQRGDSI